MMEKQLNFITKRSSVGARCSAADVTITMGSDATHDKKRGFRRVVIHFRNMASKRVAKSGYTVVAIDGDRLYFSNASETVGYKLFGSSQCDTRTIQILDKRLANWAETRVGNYYLEFDEELNYWYIDFKNRY